ncbi:YitT family protein [Metasolibacillus sp.]|uniref:YczE/YyaS/YitT family protein n=1 Tax=Metasolibacillus sp. TaxID=2703680 RepID=UPI0025E0FBFD|nr:YitT family protein [Metasolibacillus sp.]MCT6924893.1 YitT family protein [Metasolibacillus sp.]MCT6941161.1 YitT family protein [Metasolibacillus sp.]
MKYIFYLIGIMMLTLGISLTIQSNLGTSPFDALLVGLSIHVGLTVGSWEIVIAILLIGCNAILARQRPEWLGLVTAFITGVGIDLWLFLWRDTLMPTVWYSQAICFIVGLVIIGLGTAIYLYVNFAPIPIDRLTLLLQKLMKTNLLIARTLIYFVFLVLAMLFHGPIGIGTVLTVCLGGFLLHFCMPYTEKALSRFVT